VKNLFKSDKSYIYSFNYKGWDCSDEFDLTLQFSELKHLLKHFRQKSICSIEHYNRKLYLVSIGPELPPYFYLKRYISKLMAIHGSKKVLDVMFDLPYPDYDDNELETMEDHLKDYFGV